ncbi:thioredoxin family protein [Hoeflea sp. G2-23]|uniref:Thioredoxin family protein n=1 Tax=Hoeflea algicola TaxID=2983763 RepID=A0ABT3Z6T0_9HYPH|nr:thioredoxin family protein [Hoeflea algicola]MCY0147452.1 thioredoxin family protein [Hoeflea algicola]
MAAVPPLCDFGWKPVNATLPGVDGKDHDILAQAGENGLVVVFICNHCPYVVAVIDRIVQVAKDLAELGVGFVAISSNDVTSHPQDSFDNMKLFAEKHGFPFPYLYDEDQAVGRGWGAVCTPDFFGFNADMELQYRGRLDASRKKAGATGLRRDLYEAMKQIVETGKGPEEQIASMGCSIKWKDAS